MFFRSKTITVEFGCNKADRPKMLAEPPAYIVFDYTYMRGTILTLNMVSPTQSSLLLQAELNIFFF